MRKRTPIAAGSALVVVVILALGETAEHDTPTTSPTPTPTATATPSPSPSPSATSEAPSPVPTPPTPTTLEALPVTRVVDGDTIHVTRDGERVTVRIIGIDTPETVHPREPVECYGPEASAEAKRLLAGQSVILTPDPSQGNEDGEDRYDRFLAYVDLPSGLDYGAHMIEAGYAEEATYDGHYARQAAYRAAEDLAKAAGAGQWSAC